MTQDEQEALSFRYIAPRVMILTSGHVAVIPMIGNNPPRIYNPVDFAQWWHTYIPTMNELEEASVESDRAMRARRTSTPKPLQPNADDLA